MAPDSVDEGRDHGLAGFLAPAAGSLALSLLLAPLGGHPYDMEVWLKTGRLMAEGRDIYSPPDHIGYPPSWAYICLAAYYVYTALGEQAWRVAVKLPLLVLVPLTAYEVYKLTGRYECYIITLCSGPLYLVSSVWGQINVVSAYFAVRFLRKLERNSLRGVLDLSASLSFKPIYVILLPYLAASYGPRRFAAALPLLASIPAAVTAATIAAGRASLETFLDTMYYQPMRLELTGYGLMNIWSFLALFPQYRPNPLASQVWIPVIAALGIYLGRRGCPPPRAALALLAAYMALYPWVSEATLLDACVLAAPLIARGIDARPLALLVAAGTLFNVLNGGLKMLGGLSRVASEVYLRYGGLIWMLRGIMGLVCTVFSLCLLAEAIHPAPREAYRRSS
ncbi:hypothetical protein B6U99_03635 [Candidatus Geothermarchaeota archaeon ex4572_27]|nr:MAG: hypothetical protein B6U99_03635 [Candidatus Geothermarchaeota archaeon ex4572_27]